MKQLALSCLFISLALSLAAFPDSVSLEIKPHAYADNTEFFVSPYRTGETILGSSVAASVRYDHSKEISFRLGVYLNYFFGDDIFPSQAAPVFDLEYHLGTNFRFIFGSLDNTSRHRMPDAILSEELEYTRESELGFQLKLDYPYIWTDSWINWNKLDTPEHREYFDYGNSLRLPVWLFVFALQTYISHHGGQLYDSGPCRDDLQLGLGIENTYPLANPCFNNAGWSFRAFGDKDVPDRAFSNLTTTGYGFLGEIWFNVFLFKIYADYWYGQHFITEEGNPLYRTDNGWFFCGFRNEKELAGNSLFISELRVHKYSLSRYWEYQYRIEFKSAFNFLLKEF